MLHEHGYDQSHASRMTVAMPKPLAANFLASVGAAF